MKVGFFDSGKGGLCILEAFKRLCPKVETEYIADSANCPYGNKSAEEIIRLSVANTERLLGDGCDVIVVACNTATAAAIDYLRAGYPSIPFVGVEPAIKPAVNESKSGIVAVLATAGTFAGRLYNSTRTRYADGVKVIASRADEFVGLVERGVVDGPEAERVVKKIVEPLIDEGADVIVLGCTHFSHLKGVIERVAAGRAKVIDSSEAVARQVKRIVEEIIK